MNRYVYYIRVSIEMPEPLSPELREGLAREVEAALRDAAAQNEEHSALLVEAGAINATPGVL